MRSLLFLTFVSSASAFFGGLRSNADLPCEDQRGTEWCAIKKLKGKCGKKGVQKKCNLTCESCPTCENKKDLSWCEAKLDKCHKKGFQKKCFGSCKAECRAEPEPEPVPEVLPTCEASHHSVYALCDGKPFHKWGVGPEGEAQAIKNCNWAAKLSNEGAGKWGFCSSVEHFLSADELMFKPKCGEFEGTVHALCSGQSVGKWGVGPEGKEKATKNCNWAAHNANGGHGKWGFCPLP